MNDNCWNAYFSSYPLVYVKGGHGDVVSFSRARDIQKSHQKLPKGNMSGLRWGNRHFHLRLARVRAWQRQGSCEASMQGLLPHPLRYCHLPACARLTACGSWAALGLLQMTLAAQMPSPCAIRCLRLVLKNILFLSRGTDDDQADGNLTRQRKALKSVRSAAAGTVLAASLDVDEEKQHVEKKTGHNMACFRAAQHAECCPQSNVPCPTCRAISNKSNSNSSMNSNGNGNSSHELVSPLALWKDARGLVLLSWPEWRPA